MEDRHRHSCGDLVDRSLTICAPILRGAVQVAIRSLNERAQRKGATAAAWEAVIVVDDAGGAELDDCPTEFCAAFRERNVEESIVGLCRGSDRGEAVGYVKFVDHAVSAGAGDFIDHTVSVIAATAGGAVEVAIRAFDRRSPGERTVGSAVETVQNGGRSTRGDFEND